MIGQDKILLTKDGLENLKKEYRQLTEVRRPEAVERMAQARLMGDLAENNEYTSAKEDLVFIDDRIEELGKVIDHAALIDDNHRGCQAVNPGCRVTVAINGRQEEHIYWLVGNWEADPATKKISFESPLGKSLIGKKVGEEVEIEAPAGKIVYTIKKID